MSRAYVLAIALLLLAGGPGVPAHGGARALEPGGASAAERPGADAPGSRDGGGAELHDAGASAACTAGEVQLVAAENAATGNASAAAHGAACSGESSGWGRVKLTDDLGVTVKLERPPARIVSLSPSNTELLFALEVGERLVGVTEFCNHPEAALEIQNVAGYNSLNVESVIGVRPDLIVAARGNPRDGLESLRRMGIPVFALDIQSIEQLVEGVQRLGRLIGAEARAAQLAESWEQRVAEVQASADLLPLHPRVMWGYWSDPIYTAGANTIIDDVFTLAGGVNVGRQAPGEWPQVSLETVVGWAPQIIITTYHASASDPASLAEEVVQLQHTDGWKSVPAVRQGNVAHVDADLLNRPGPRLIDGLEAVAGIIRRVATQ